MHALYTLFLTLLTPILLIRGRLKYGPGQSAPAQRLGIGAPGPQDLWIHAASVGEARAIASLAQAWAQQYRVLVTTTTPTGAEQIRQLAPDCSHAFLPYDLPWAMRHWHQCIRPKALVLVETELWPNLIHQARCPVFLVNGRMSAKSESGYQRFASLTRPMLKKVQVLAQTTDHAKAFGRLGAADVQVMGNLKYDLEPLPDDAVEKARTGLGDGPWIVAASTHATEETAILEACRDLPARLLLVPRHPQRFDEVARLIEGQGLAVVRLSQGDAGDAQVVLGDQMGQLRSWYSQAQVVFVGGTLIDHGGQNPIEAAEQGCVLVAGPSRFNFTQVFEHLGEGALVDVDPASLKAGLQQALELDGQSNRHIVRQHQGASARISDRIDQALR